MAQLATAGPSMERMRQEAMKGYQRLGSMMEGLKDGILELDPPESQAIKLKIKETLDENSCFGEESHLRWMDHVFRESLLAESGCER